VLGDFNIHVDQPLDNFSSSFSTLLNTFDLKQHITDPTHSSGHTLDLLVTKSSTILTTLGTCEPSLSDHSAVFWKIPAFVTSRPTRIIKTYRKFSSINTDLFSADIVASSVYSNPAPNLSAYIIQFCPHFNSRQTCSTKDWLLSSC